MKHRLHPIFAPYMAPAGDDGTDTGGKGAPDRGDTVAVVSEEDTKAAEDKALAEKIAADKAAADAAAAEKAATEKAAADKAAADKAAAGGDKNDKSIPVSRHAEILRKEREAREEAERKLAQYAGGDRIKVFNKEIADTEATIDGLQTEYDKAIADGDLKVAKEKMTAIRRLDKELTEKKISVSTQAAVSQATERMRYETAVERLEAAYPVLNPDHEDHDAELAQDVLDLAATYNQRGETPTAAIQKAARKLLGVETKKQQSAVETTPRVDATEAKKTAEEVEEARKKAQVEKNLETQKKQPADTSKVGADSDKAGGSITAKDILKMKQDDFNKLDEETLSRMRGDVIA